MSNIKIEITFEYHLGIKWHFEYEKKFLFVKINIVMKRSWFVSSYSNCEDLSERTSLIIQIRCRENVVDLYLE